MAGICGVFNRAGYRPVVFSELEAMHLADAGRGPEGFTSLVAGAVGLGYQAFSPWTLRASIGLPIRQGPLLLSCDTRLDDRLSLCRTLDLEHPEGRSDAELILAAYSRWGVEFPKHLKGDFALLLYDEKRSRLLACRDRLGIRDLAYSLDLNRCIVASTPAQVAALAGSKVNEGRLAEYLAGLFYNGEESFFEKIYYLPPGACLVVEAQTHRLWKYWELEAEADLFRRPEEELIEEFLDLLQSSVRGRMEGAGRVGVSLSGGPDSAALAALASDIGSSSRLTAFSYVFPSYPSCDEKHYIDLILQHSGLEGRFLDGDRLWPLSDFENWPVFPDFPSQDPYVHLPLGLCRMAASEGFTVLLNGHFADLLFHGGRFWAAEQLSRPLSLVRTILSNFSSLDWRGDLLSRGLGARLPPAILKGLRRIRGRGGREFPMLEAEWVGACDLEGRLEAQQGPGMAVGRRDRSLRARHLLMPLIPQGLSAARRLHNEIGVEIVDPFWEPGLLEFVSRCPADLLARPTMSKWLLRKSIENRLPAEVAWRRDKTSLYEFFRQGLLVEESGRILEVFGNSELIARGYLNREWIEAEVRASEEWKDFGFPLWRCLTAELWLRNLNKSGNSPTMNMVEERHKDGSNKSEDTRSSICS